MEPTRVELLDYTGEWQPLHGITNVVIFETPEAMHAAGERVREAQALMTAFIRAYAEAARPVMEQVGRAFQTMREAGLVEDDGKLTKSPDRPAWQSPYGPARKRR